MSIPGTFIPVSPLLFCRELCPRALWEGVLELSPMATHGHPHYRGSLVARVESHLADSSRDCSTATHRPPFLSVLEQHLWPKTCSHKLLTTSVIAYDCMPVQHILHYTLTIESWVVTVQVPGPCVSHQEWVCLDWFGLFTASPPFQCLIRCIMNGLQGWDLNS